MHPYTNIAIRASRRAGDLLNHSSWKMRQCEPLIKKRSLCDTEIRAEAETAAIQIIATAYPTHGIYTSTVTRAPQDSSIVWYIDVLNGITNYLYGIPHFSVSVGVRENTRMMQAVIFNPANNEMFFAERGVGSYANDRRIRVQENDSSQKRLIAIGEDATGNGADLNSQQRLLDLHSCATVRIFGSTSLALAYVAAGRLDGFYQCGLQPWEVAAGLLIAQEAGALVTDYSGESAILETGEIIAGSPKTLNILVQHIQKHPLDTHPVQDNPNSMRTRGSIKSYLPN